MTNTKARKTVQAPLATALLALAVLTGVTAAATASHGSPCASHSHSCAVRADGGTGNG